MKHLSLSLFLLCIGTLGMAQSIILYSGEVINAETKNPIPDVHVLNKNTGVVAVTDEDGFFSIQVYKHHVLQASVIGYETLVFNIDAEQTGNYIYKSLELDPKIYALKGVTIKDEKEEVPTVVRKPEEKWVYGEYGLKLSGTGAPVPVKPTLENPISLLYDWFSREGKQKRKLQELLKEEAIAKAVAARYENDLIWEATGLYGEELIRLKNFCNLPEQFILNSSDYDFLIAVKNCYVEYKSR